MGWSRANNRKLYPRAFLTVAELGKRHLLHLHMIVRLRERSRKSHSCDEVGSSWDFFLDTTLPIFTFGAHAHAARNIVVNSAPVQTPLDALIAWLDGLSSNNDLTTAWSFTSVGQLRLEGLLFGSHELTHGCLQITDMVIFISITVKDWEFEILNLFKLIGNLERCGEIWVLLVLNLLGWANLDPLVIALFIDVTKWIWLTHNV